MEQLRKREEVALLIGKPTSWLRWAERQRLIPYIKVGQQIRYRLSDVETWLASRRVPPSAPGKAKEQ